MNERRKVERRAEQPHYSPKGSRAFAGRRKAAQDCPNRAHMGKHACADKSQCWEPCGDLGHDERFVAVVPTPEEPCCGEFATCLRACTPRGEWIAAEQRTAAPKERLGIDCRSIAPKADPASILPPPPSDAAAPTPAETPRTQADAMNELCLQVIRERNEAMRQSIRRQRNEHEAASVELAGELAAAQRNGNLALKELNASLAAKDAEIAKLKETNAQYLNAKRVAEENELKCAQELDELRADNEDAATHTDHPLSHWDRTCPACIADTWEASSQDRRKGVQWVKNAKAQWIKENLKEGEEYSGLILGKDGESDYHLILRPGEAESVTLAQAKVWAKKAGGELPTCREQALLYANLKEHFKEAYYWSNEQHAAYSDYAWSQHFINGYQYSSHIDNERRTRAVRRVPI